MRWIKQQKEVAVGGMAAYVRSLDATTGFILEEREQHHRQL